MVSKIKEAIKQFLAFTKTPTSTPDIYETITPYTTSKTPEASIRRSLQELWKKGHVKKYYILNDVRHDYPIDREVSSRLPREYQTVRLDYFRKIVSTVIYCGMGKARKVPQDVKMWTHEEKQLPDRMEFLAKELYDYLQTNYDKCYYVFLDLYVYEMSFDEFKGTLGYDDYETTSDPDVIFPTTNEVIELRTK